MCGSSDCGLFAVANAACCISFWASTTHIVLQRTENASTPLMVPYQREDDISSQKDYHFGCGKGGGSSVLCMPHA